MHLPKYGLVSLELAKLRVVIPIAHLETPNTPEVKTDIVSKFGTEVLLSLMPNCAIHGVLVTSHTASSIVFDDIVQEKNHLAQHMEHMNPLIRGSASPV